MQCSTVLIPATDSFKRIAFPRELLNNENRFIFGRNLLRVFRFECETLFPLRTSFFDIGHRLAILSTLCSYQTRSAETLLQRSHKVNSDLMTFRITQYRVLISTGLISGSLFASSLKLIPPQKQF